MITTVLVYIFVAVAVIQVIYYLCFIPFLTHKNKLKTTDQVPISVIVCSKNESENLHRLVPLLLKQSYPTFELVLINDASSDNTLEVIENFALEDTRIKLVNVENNEAFWANKKYALTLGIKAAKYEHLLFTDADCIPASEHWIDRMGQSFTEKKSIVLGYGKYETIPYSFLNMLVRYETLLAAIQGFGYAKLGSPYTAVGRNLGYTKREFFRVKGFIKHIQIRSGDDDLFIQDAAHASNTTLCTEVDGFTISKGPSTLSEWFRQKRRHISTSHHYKRKHQFFLGLFYATKLMFWILFPIVLFLNPNPITYGTVVTYFVINLLITGISAKKLHELSLVFFLPLLELFLVLFHFTIFIANSISKPTHWK